MPEPSTLQHKARDECLRRAQDAFPDHELDVELLDSARSWHPFLLRHVFRQPMVVWRRSSHFDVLVDPATGEPVGLENPDGWRDCRWVPMAEADVLAMAARTALVDDQAMAVASLEQGPRGCAEAVLRPRREGADARPLRVRINPARRVLISIEPIGQGA
jgi:hypothetical protein